jgi:hypothetical protein
LALGLDTVATTFERRAQKQDMRRRATPSQALLRHLVLGIGRFPRGRQAPAASVPEARPDPEAAAAQFRMAVARLELLLDTWSPERQLQVFVKHPVLGDLNLPEWIRFHYVHCRHHARQIAARRRWLEVKKKSVGR